MSQVEITPILPEGWERARGYAHAIAHSGGRTIRVAGQVAATSGGGGVPQGMGMGSQFRKAIANVVECVRAGGGSAESLVTLRVYVTDIQAFRDAGAEVGAAWREVMGRHFPAMTLVEVSALYDPNAVIEIEAEAVVA